MASLTLRNIPDDIQRRFRAQASAKGRSMEAEARQLVIPAVSGTAAMPRKSIGQMLYEGSPPGVNLPELPYSPASYAAFDDE